MKKKVLLLDVNHPTHRAHWAIQRSPGTSKGAQLNAVFGVVSMLLTMMMREKPDAIIACFDEGKETLRHKEHGEYKAGRQETPDDFYVQIPRVHQCLEAFAVPILSSPDYEADDLLGTLAVRGLKEGYSVIIVSGDRDLFQLPDGDIQVAVPNGGYSEPEYLDAKGVEKKLGVRPDQVPDYKGLVGDSSDNLKGVKGIGPKTAVKLLQTYGTIENLYEHLPEVQGSAKEKLMADRESAFFCKRMATLVTDIPLAIDLKEASERQANIDDVLRLFAELEFFTLRSRFRKFLAADPYAKKHFTGEIVFDIEEPLFAEASTSAKASADRSGGGEERVTVEQLPLLD